VDIGSARDLTPLLLLGSHPPKKSGLVNQHTTTDANNRSVSLHSVSRNALATRANTVGRVENQVSERRLRPSWSALGKLLYGIQIAW
jgi:hypothetical protein